MSLSAALRDRARVLRKHPTGGAKVEGRTPMRAVPGEWFRCRLVIEPAPEREDQQGGRRVVAAASLVTGHVDENGEPVEVRASDTLEVERSGPWRIVAEPQPLAAGRGRVVGWLVQLQRLAEPVREVA